MSCHRQNGSSVASVTAAGRCRTEHSLHNFLCATAACSSNTLDIGEVFLLNLSHIIIYPVRGFCGFPQFHKVNAGKAPSSTII
jgi:hypothetical protein